MKVCQYCGTENKDTVSICSSCGGNEFKNKCGNCGTVFEEGNYCPRCGVKAGTKAKHCPDCGAEYYSVACPDCGYKSSDNTTVAYTDNLVRPVKKRKTWLWVLGWIFIFPVPLTILMIRNQKLDKKVKIGIIAVGWIVYLMFGFIGGDTSENKTDVNGPQPTIESSAVQETSPADQNESESATKESNIDEIVEGYNASATNKLIFAEEFVVSDKESGHYRTEFRLAVYQDAVGKSYKLGEQIVDIISTKSIFGAFDVRIYTDNATLDQCIELIRFASPLLDSSMDENTIKETIDYVSEHKTANGYYYGKLGLLLLGSDAEGYDLMIKTN